MQPVLSVVACEIYDIETLMSTEAGYLLMMMIKVTNYNLFPQTWLLKIARKGSGFTL